MSDSNLPPKRIGEILVEHNLIAPEQLDRALHTQAQVGGTVGEHLVRQGATTDVNLLRALSKQTGLKYVQLPKIAVPDSTLRLLKVETVKKHRVLPIHLDGRNLLLGLVNPTDYAAIQQVELETGLSVQPVLISGVQLDDAIQFFDTSGGYGQASLTLSVTDVPSAREAAVQDLRELLRLMVRSRGQDLYLTAGAIPSVRIDNELRRLPFAITSGEDIARLLNDVLTPEQKERFSHDLELDFAYIVEGVGRFRCNVYRQRSTLALTARHIVEKIPSIQELGLPNWARDFALRKQGFILITGPAGHGKSTSMAAMIDLINRERHANIITIEDPIEFIHPHKNSNVSQREVGSDTRSFAEGLRHMFRQSPDVMVIGELRDQETTSIALSAAETGHLVLATMHATNATTAIDRIIDMFPPEQHHQVRAQIAENLLLILSQRLVRRTDGRGRALAYERISTSLRVRNAIREGKAYALRSLMQSNHEEIVSIDHSLASLVGKGFVSKEEALKYADSPGYVDTLLAAHSKAHGAT